MALTRRLRSSSRRIAKNTAIHLARYLVRHFPVDAGPAGWRSFLGRVRLAVALRLVARENEAAEKLVGPILETEHGGRAWHVTALAREQRGDHAGGLAAARRASESTPDSIEALLVHRRLAARTDNDVEAREVLERLVAIPPRYARHATAMLEALAHAEPAVIRSYLKVLQDGSAQYATEHFHEVEAELRLVETYKSNPGALPDELRKVSAERRRAVRIVTHALSACQAWDELSDYLDRIHSDKHGGSGLTSVFRLRRAANRAFADGSTAAGVSIARHVLAINPGDHKLREALDAGVDQVAIADKGWPELPSAGTTPYEAKPQAVLSVLAQSLPFTSGGYASRSHGVLTGLSSRGWDVRAVTRLGFPHTWWRGTGGRQVTPVDEIDGIGYHRLVDKGVYDYPQHPLAAFTERFTEHLVRQAVAHQARLIHASSFYINGLAGAAAARRLGIPFVYEMRGLEELMKVSRDESFEGSDRHRFLAAVEYAACRDADAVLVITEALGREMVSRGIAPEKVVVMPNGVHGDRFTPRPRDADLAKELGVESKTVIGYAGGLVDYEGLDLLLEAAAALKQRRQDFHVLVVGDGHHDQALRGMVDRLRLADMVTFTGRVPHAEIGRYISLFDITPFPRLPLPVCELISPIKPFEAMAMGKAVVASDVAALAEIVDDGATGLLFTKGSAEALTRALERLLDAPDLRHSLGEAARNWVVAERDWSRIVATVEATYRDLLDRPTHNGSDTGPTSPPLQPVDEQH
jgi:glycosyltransferase involved in cell wall biosynthesis